jgi:ribonuclease HII
MPYLVGVDEAGYGPNLGPLVVAATAWSAPRGVGPEKLYSRLAKLVRPPLADAEPTPHAAADSPDDRLAIGDSKQLYKSGGTLGNLERGVHAALDLLDRPARRWCDIWPRVDRECACQTDSLPWHEGYDEPLPTEGSCGWDLPRLQTLINGLKSAKVGLVELQATLLYPGRFNELVDRYDNKAEVLSHTSLTLVRRVLDSLPDEQVIVACDKHGGRGYYAGLLQHYFPDALVQIRTETRELGCYVLQHAGRQVEFRFLAKGERMLPIAWASMTAKYLRELAMRPFNAFWQRHVADLEPTAGYPNDARRFWEAIRPAQEQLGIADRVLWRTR